LILKALVSTRIRPKATSPRNCRNRTAVKI